VPCPNAKGVEKGKEQQIPTKGYYPLKNVKTRRFEKMSKSFIWTLVKQN
jgi:hypothetical protein